MVALIMALVGVAVGVIIFEDAVFQEIHIISLLFLFVFSAIYFCLTFASLPLADFGNIILCLFYIVIFNTVFAGKIGEGDSVCMGISSLVLKNFIFFNIVIFLAITLVFLYFILRFATEHLEKSLAIKKGKKGFSGSISFESVFSYRIPFMAFYGCSFLVFMFFFLR